MGSVVKTEIAGQVGIVRIDRPGALNALNQALLRELGDQMQALNSDPRIRCLLLCGHDRAFAVGLDVSEMVGLSMVDVQQRDPLAALDDLDRIGKPIVAAVVGYALGTGFELVLACDIVVAAENARFGLPQLELGIMPGAGATQRLPRILGRAGAMDLVLTGRTVTAREALRAGLVSRVVPRENCEDEARAVCRTLCARSPLAVQMAKQAVRKAEEVSLSEGRAFERRLYTMLFATDDQKEGMRAFLEKRPAIFAGR